MQPSHRATLAAVVAALCLSALVATPAGAAGGSARIDRWSSTAELSTGTRTGTSVSSGAVRLAKSTSRLTYPDHTGTKRTWDYGTWTSEWSQTRFPATDVIPSWNAKMPTGTFLRVAVRVRKGSKVGSWDNVAHWTHGNTTIKRTSSTAQPDDLARVATDVVKATKGTTFDGWQVQVRLMRRSGTTATPVLTSVSGIASSYSTRSIATSRTTMTSGKTLAVPQYSQMTHRGHFPQYDGGGAAWCSPTSTAMVLRYFKAGPTPSMYSWAKDSHGFVDHAAAHTYDHRFRGTGNWPFNTAYAGVWGLDAFVTRMYDLREAEAFIKAGIPVVASVAFGRGGLAGAPLSATPGHLMVIVGFTSSGKVVVNDPAGGSNSQVRRTYDRAQFERAWLNGSGGVAYVVRPSSKALPATTARW